MDAVDDERSSRWLDVLITLAVEVVFAGEPISVCPLSAFHR